MEELIHMHMSGMGGSGAVSHARRGYDRDEERVQSREDREDARARQALACKGGNQVHGELLRQRAIFLSSEKVKSTEQSDKVDRGGSNKYRVKLSMDTR